MSDTPTEDKTEDKVVLFNKRFSTPTPVEAPTPKWEITYVEDKDTNAVEIVEGYIFSHMPYFLITEKMIARNEQTVDSNMASWAIPADRLVKYTRVKADAKVQEWLWKGNRS